MKALVNEAILFSMLNILHEDYTVGGEKTPYQAPQSEVLKSKYSAYFDCMQIIENVDRKHLCEIVHQL